MCGIGGQFLHTATKPARRPLDAMSLAMAFRGPDDVGMQIEPHIGLVHRRLSVRDLSPAGACPMASSDGKVWIVFNGEIYNWRELRDELKAAGAAFESESDTEVLLRGYDTWGLDLPKRLRGMFAFAIWDGRENRLFLSRDRAGEKPMFYQTTAQGLAFASSIEALKPVQDQRRINPIGMAAYLAHGFIPSSTTIWSGVSVLPPGHNLIIEPGSPARLERYWDFPRRGPSRRSLKEVEHEVERVMSDCVVRALDADVPVGVFLSGGVDSSAVAAIAARARPGLPAFSLGFHDRNYDELPYAEKVAKHLKLDHHTIRLGVQDVIDALPHLVRQYGQPFGDSSAAPSFCLARLARKHVTVCLGGDGGDEAFGGYWRVQAGVYAARYASIAPSMLRERIVPTLAEQLGTFGRRLAAMNALSLQTPGAGYGNQQTWFEALGEIAGPALTPGLSSDLVALRVGPASHRPEASVIQRLIYDDFTVQLPDAYLTKLDVASMAASLEVRSPLLDPALLELAWTLPDAARLNWARRKWLLKRIAARLVPREVVYRPKMGFAMPLARWMRGPLGDHLEGLMAESHAVAAGWIRAQPVRDRLSAHRRGDGDHAVRLWQILWLELWFRLVAEDAELAA